MLKRKLMALLLSLIMALLAWMPALPPALAQEAEELSDWTVLIYLCGSDLESKSAMGTYNLVEINKSHPLTQDLLDAVSALIFKDVDIKEPESAGVNVLIETGGCKQWHAQEELGLDIATDRLQRYEFNPLWQPGRFALVDEQPLASMCAPETLADFIRWGVAARPAQKYALVLWDHGGGSRTGLFTDEVFNSDYMELDELSSALEGGGAHFDVLIIDACMMANLETAQAVAPYADYMVASEEIAAGYGGDYKAWLNCLYDNPDIDPVQFAHMVCDAVQKKYANMGQDHASLMLTYSVTDLSKIDRLSAAFDALMENLGRLYENSPIMFNVMSTLIGRAEHYGKGDEHMIDIGSILLQESVAVALDTEVRNELLDALLDAVVYTVKGPNRSSAYGMSFCFDLSMTGETLERYIRNCHSAPYLALLDAVNEEWTAPDWVYEKTRRLKPVDTEGDYRLDMSVQIVDGVPQLVLTDSFARKRIVGYTLYYLDEESGEICRLGLDSCDLLAYTKDRQVYGIEKPGMWPALDGVLCDIERIYENASYVLYKIPIQMGDGVYDMRAAYYYNTTLLSQVKDVLAGDVPLDGTPLAPDYEGHYEVFGLWDGYDANSDMPNRNIIALSSVQGREFQLLYPIYDFAQSGRVHYARSEDKTMYRAMEIEEIPLPEGTYYMAFGVLDVFDRQYVTDVIQMYWDGERFQVLE